MLALEKLQFFAILSLIFVFSHCTVSFAPQMWAARPHLGSIFKKLLHRKTFYSPAARLRKTSPIRFGKAGAHPQLALGIAIPSSIFVASHCTVLFAPQMWATRPRLGSIFEKLLHRKTFYLCFAPAQQKTASPNMGKAVSNAILFDVLQNPFQLFPVPVLPFSLAFDWYHFSEVYR